MISFKGFLSESALNVAELNKPAGSGPNSGTARYEIFADKIWKGENHILNDGETIVIKTLEMGGKTYSASNSSDKQKFIDDFAESDGVGLKITDPKTAWSNVAKTPEYGGQGGGTKISVNTQELMTAAIVMLNKNFDAQDISVDDAAQIIDDAKGQWNNITGATGKESLLNQFTKNWYDLATAISSSNAILNIMKPAKATKVFWTGQSWDTEISEFNPKVPGIKDYNSSDIVVKGSDNVYYGFSLKKKKSTKDADPTLINKPITGNKSVLANIVGKRDFDGIMRAKQLFFTQMIMAYHSKKFGKRKSLVDQLSTKEYKDLIKKIPNEFANNQLKGKGAKGNVFWKKVDEVLNRHSDAFCEKFMNLVFRIDLQTMIDADKFKFYLLTGIGKQKGKSIGVEPAEVKDLPSTVEVLTSIFDQKNLKLGQTLNDKGTVLRQPWEYDKTDDYPAKLRYTIYNGTQSLLNLEIRYKGSKTAEPQFQAVATPVFKNLFK
jgi:hypothetical protein